MCRDIMTPDPVVVNFKCALADALDLMRHRGIKALPVVDQGVQLVGIITQTDLVRALSGVMQRPQPDAVSTVV